MFIDWEKIHIYVKPGPTDMRKQINSLSVLVQEEMKYDPFTGSLFIFCNKRRNRMKILYWDRNGFCLWLKRLEKQKFPWPLAKEQVYMLDESKLKMLLDGIDFWKAHKKLKYNEIF